MTIQLYVGARGKTRAGDIVEIVSKDDDRTYPFNGGDGECYTPSGKYWDDDEPSHLDIIELLPPRQYVDTPFEVGKTYPTRNGTSKRTVVGWGLIVEDRHGFQSFRHLDGCLGRNGRNGFSDLLPTPIEAKPKQTVTLELTDEQLAKVREALK